LQAAGQRWLAEGLSSVAEGWALGKVGAPALSVSLLREVSPGPVRQPVLLAKGWAPLPNPNVQ